MEVLLTSRVSPVSVEDNTTFKFSVFDLSTYHQAEYFVQIELVENSNILQCYDRPRQVNYLRGSTSHVMFQLPPCLTICDIIYSAEK